MGRDATGAGGHRTAPQLRWSAANAHSEVGASRFVRQGVDEVTQEHLSGRRSQGRCILPTEGRRVRVSSRQRGASDQLLPVGGTVQETGSPTDARSVVRSSRLLGGLRSELLSDVLARGTVLRRRPGRAVLNPREDAAAVILDGVVISHAVASSGTEYIRRLHAAAETVGLLGVLGHPSTSDELVARSTVQLLRLPGSDVRMLINEHGEVSRACLRAVTAQLMQAQLEDELLVGTTTSQRLSLRILELAERWGLAGPSGIHITVHLTQEELATWARVSLESAGRTLHTLREADIVYTGRRELIVRDLAALRRRASQRPGDSTLSRLLASIG